MLPDYLLLVLVDEKFALLKRLKLTAVFMLSKAHSTTH
jgi:hypothetical protein